MFPTTTTDAMEQQRFHIFVHPGDASAEVDRLVRSIGTAAAAGLHKTIFATQADQTVVFLTGRDAPLAGALRGRPGWVEPEG